jgi:hypothetical protein
MSKADNFDLRKEIDEIGRRVSLEKWKKVDVERINSLIRELPSGNLLDKARQVKNEMRQIIQDWLLPLDPQTKDTFFSAESPEEWRELEEADDKYWQDQANREGLMDDFFKSVGPPQKIRNLTTGFWSREKIGRDIFEIQGDYKTVVAHARRMLDKYEGLLVQSTTHKKELFRIDKDILATLWEKEPLSGKPPKLD